MKQIVTIRPYRSDLYYEWDRYYTWRSKFYYGWDLYYALLQLTAAAKQGRENLNFMETI